MELIEVLQGIISEHEKAQGKTDLVIGTVTSSAPLQISLNQVNMPALPASVLRLTSEVVEKKIPIIAHKHTLDGKESDKQLTSIVCYENGVALPVSGGFIMLNRGLTIGDKVLMLRVLGGQNYIVLSRVI